MTATSDPPHAHAATAPATKRDIEGENALTRAFARQLTLEGLRAAPRIFRESRMFSELSAFRSHPLAMGDGLPRGEGQPVFLVPGYLAGDASLAPLSTALRRAEFRPALAGIRLNVGCATAMVELIEARLAAHVAASGGQRAILIGQSRGGTLGRVLAVRRPELVAGLVTLGTPLRDPLAVNLFVLANVGLVGALGALGVPGVLSVACMRADRCCGSSWRHGEAPLPRGFPFVSIYSRSDGIVDYRACLDPAARHIEVDSSHCGMAFNVDAVRALGAELDRMRS